jgi:phage terminase large subunit-like protein
MMRYPTVADRLCVASLIDASPEGDASLLDQFLDSLSPEQLDWLPYDWEFWARDEQLPPQGDWTTWLFLGGRGSGKTRAGAEWVLDKVRAYDGKGPPPIFHLVAPTEADYRDVMINGPAGLCTIAAPDERPRYIGGARKVLFPNGAYAICFSAEQPERLRGPQCMYAWADELAAWKYLQETWDMMSFGLRLGSHPQVMVSTTPKPLPLIHRLIKDQTSAVTRGSTFRNRANLAPTFFE